jgi:hypothetical protein
MDRAERSAWNLLERGRDCYQRRRWTDAFTAQSRVGETEPALVLPGRARLARGETRAGLTLLDEAMGLGNQR